MQSPAAADETAAIARFAESHFHGTPSRRTAARPIAAASVMNTSAAITPRGPSVRAIPVRKGRLRVIRRPSRLTRTGRSSARRASAVRVRSGTQSTRLPGSRRTVPPMATNAVTPSAMK